jgi:hypothetical protein
MECFESLDDAKKKISADLSSKNPQYQMIPFTSSTRPSNNKPRPLGSGCASMCQWSGMARQGPRGCTRLPA